MCSNKKPRLILCGCRNSKVVLLKRWICFIHPDIPVAEADPTFTKPTEAPKAHAFGWCGLLFVLLEVALILTMDVMGCKGKITSKSRKRNPAGAKKNRNKKKGLARRK